MSSSDCSSWEGRYSRTGPPGSTLGQGSGPRQRRLSTENRMFSHQSPTTPGKASRFVPSCFLLESLESLSTKSRDDVTKVAQETRRSRAACFHGFTSLNPEEHKHDANPVVSIANCWSAAYSLGFHVIVCSIRHQHTCISVFSHLK